MKLLLRAGLLSALVWLPQLRASFDVDEAVSYWIARDGYGDLIHRAMTFQYQSPLYYSLLFPVARLFSPAMPEGEALLRLVSALTVFVAALGVYRIARREIGEERAWAVLLLFACAPAVCHAAALARSYGCALACSVWSVDACLVWLRTRQKGSFVLAFLLAAGAIYSHYLFGPLLGYLWLLAWIVPSREERVQSVLWATGGCVAAVLAPVPLLLQLKILFASHAALAWMLPPDFEELLATWFSLPAIVLGAGTAALVIRGRQSAAFRAALRARRAALAIFGLWYLLPPLLLFVPSYFGIARLYSERYFLWNQAGFALFAGAFLEAVPSAKGRNVLLGALIALFAAGSIAAAPAREDWRSAMAAVNKAEAGRDIPLLYFSGLVESEPPEWRADPEGREYLLSLPRFYGWNRDAVILPRSDDTAENRKYLAEQFAALRDAREVLLLSRKVNFLDGRGNYIETWLGRNGFVRSGATEFPGVELWTYTR